MFLICRSKLSQKIFSKYIFIKSEHVTSIKFRLLPNTDECPIKNKFSFDVSNTLPKFNDSSLPLSLLPTLASSLALCRKCPYLELCWSVFYHIRTRITPNIETFYAAIILQNFSVTLMFLTVFFAYIGDWFELFIVCIFWQRSTPCHCSFLSLALHCRTATLFDDVHSRISFFSSAVISITFLFCFAWKILTFLVSLCFQEEDTKSPLMWNNRLFILPIA